MVRLLKMFMELPGKSGDVCSVSPKLKVVSSYISSYGSSNSSGSEDLVVVEEEQLESVSKL